MATATIGNVVNANPTPGNNFYQFTHNQNTGANGLTCYSINNVKRAKLIPVAIMAGNQ